MPFASLFQIEGSSREQAFQRGIVLAVLQPVLTIVSWTVLAYLSRFSPAIWTPRRALEGLGDSIRSNAVTTIYGTVGFVLEYLAIRDLRKAVRGLNLTSIASVVGISLAFIWSGVACCLTFVGFALCYVGLFYPGQSIFPP